MFRPRLLLLVPGQLELEAAEVVPRALLLAADLRSGDLLPQRGHQLTALRSRDPRQQPLVLQLALHVGQLDPRLPHLTPENNKDIPLCAAAHLSRHLGLSAALDVGVLLQADEHGVLAREVQLVRAPRVLGLAQPRAALLQPRHGVNLAQPAAH